MVNKNEDLELAELGSNENKDGKPIVSKSDLLDLANSARTETNALPYRPASKKCNVLNSVTPTKLYYETQYALSVFAEMGIDTTEYVRDKLNYTSTLAVCSAFGAEQVDSIALAIYQIENGGCFVLGDGAGLGKGRACAGLLRYAYQKGMIPAFFTKDSSLYSSIYRDIIDIGGFGSGSEIPKPFILNGRGSKQFSEERQEDVFQNDIIVDDKLLFRSLPKKEILELLSKKGVPNGYDILLSTYSVFSSDRFGQGTASKNVKTVLDFFGKYEEKLFVLLDEAHLAAGDGNVNSNLELIQKSKAKIVFSSATFAKRYDNLKFYVGRTAMAQAGVAPDKVQEFVDRFKDNALEFISQGLAESGQMIRREKTLDGCDVSYKYQLDKKNEQWSRYDVMMGLLRDIIAFTRSADYKRAVERTIEKLARENKIGLPDRPKPDNRKERAEWEADNKGRFDSSKYFSATVKNRNSWIENLLFALKADFVAENTIALLDKKYKYNNFYPNGTTEDVNTNLKPIITVRNTGQSNIDLLDKQIGQELSDKEADFSYTLIRVLEQCINGTILFTEINPNKEQGEKEKFSFKQTIEFSMFDDEGKAYNDLMQKIVSSESGLPISPLDYIIDKVAKTERQSWDYEYSKTNSYNIEDSTKRSLKLVKNSDGKWVYLANKTESNSLKIARFNKGHADSIIINVAASTGESFQSSFKYEDKRKRSMLLHQVELDVSVEMQKLGRVNRTGQINFPEYQYIVSMVPSEIRRLMSLRKKLRSLSATSTGNMNQASSYVEITDKSGNPLEDIFTKYGYDVLQVFLQENWDYKNYLPSFDNWFEQKLSPEEKLDIYCREIEIIPAEKQEYFYDNINRFYAEKRIQMLANNEWDLDSDIINYKASTKNKAILYHDTGENAFKAPVYVQDVYVTAQSKPYAKDELSSVMDKFTKGKKHSTWYKEFSEDLKSYVAKYEEDRLAKVVYYDTETDSEGKKLGKVELADVIKLNEELAERTKSNVAEMFDWMVKVICGGFINGQDWSGLTIGKPCTIPFNESIVEKASIELAAEKITEDEYENKLGTAGMVNAKFVGYKIEGKDGLLNPSNITLVFAMLNGDGAEYRIKPTRHNKAIIEDFIVAKTKRLSIIDLQQIADWKVEQKPRVLVKTITGNLLRAYDLYNKMRKEGDRVRIGSYTTIDGGIEKGIIISNMIHQEISQETETYVPVNSEDILDSYEMHILADGLSFVEDKRLKIFFVGDDKKSANNSVYASRIREFMEIAGKHGLSNGIHENELRYTYKDGKKSKKRSKVNVFYVKYEKPIADFLYDISKEVVLAGASPLQYGEKDEFKEVDGGKQEDEKKRGIFEYTPEFNYDPNSKPPNYLGYETSSEFKQGIVKTEYELDAATCMAFNLLPIRVNNDITYQRLVARLKSQRKLEEMVKFVLENKESYVRIAGEAARLSITYLKYFFGNMSLANVGRIIASKITSEEIPLDIEADEKEMEQQYDSLEVPLNIESAQDFLIKFTV